MPACSDCKWFVDSGKASHCSLAKPTGHPKYDHKRSVRACVLGTLLKHLPCMKGSVLEIGCGVWKVPRRLLRKASVSWVGLDPQKHNPKKNIWDGTVGSIPFPDSTFDWVLAFSTIEHWGGYKDTVEDGLNEINRVLKPGGKALISAPFCIHGEDLFYKGLSEEFVGILRGLKGWESLCLEEWRRCCEPLDPLREWMKEYERYGKRSKRACDLFSEDQGDIVSWYLEVLMTKG